MVIEKINLERVKKVGTLIGDTEDLKRRSQLASAAMNKYNKIWTSKGIYKIKKQN